MSRLSLRPEPLPLGHVSFALRSQLLSLDRQRSTLPIERSALGPQRQPLGPEL